MKKLPLIISFLLAATVGMVGCDSDDNDTVVPAIQPEDAEPTDSTGLVIIGNECIDTVNHVIYTIDAKTNTAVVKAGRRIDGVHVDTLRSGCPDVQGEITLLDHFEANGHTITVTGIGDYSLCGLEKLTTVHIPQTITSIGAFAFAACSSMEYVTVPEGITAINDYAFYGCTSLKRVSLPESLTTIAQGAFHKCEQMEGITLPENLEVIGSIAFCMSGLKTLTIPASVKEIGENALFTESLQTIYSYIKNPFEVRAFNKQSEFFDNATLCVPKGCKKKYQDTTDWCLFKNIVEME